MKLTQQAEEQLTDLSQRLHKTKEEVIELALFYFYDNRKLFITCPECDDMWLAEEMPFVEDLVKFTCSHGHTFFWSMYGNLPDTEQSRKLIGERIKKLREETGMTQDQLAEKIDMTKQNISRIELGKYSTGQDILSKIATALGKRLDIV